MIVANQIFEKKLDAQIWVKRVKTGPETRFFAIFASLVF